MAILAPHVSEVLTRLEKVREKSTGGWEALCPGHEDNRRSLGISLGKDGKVLLKCGANCDTEAVVRAMGLEMKDLWPPKDDWQPTPKSNGDRKIATTYDYRDPETGNLLFQVVRWEPKGFSQRRPLQGGWVWSLDGGLYRRDAGGKWKKLPDGETASGNDVRLEPVQRVLYRLPELDAADPSAWVFVPEGEKDVDALRALGLVATCNPQGAGKWMDRFSLCLKGRKVCLLPDNDATGRDHAQKIVASLAGHAERTVTVELPDLPVKGDVSDWLAAGGTAEALVAMADGVKVEAPPKAEPEFRDPIPASLLQRCDPLDTWLWDGYLARDEITLLSALWKAGKTTLLAHLLVALDAGGKFCGRDVRPSRVLYVAEEGEGRWAERRDKLGIRDHVEFQVRPFAGRPSGEKWESLLRHIARCHAERKYDVVVFDTLANLWPVRDENDAAGVQTALMPLHGMTKGLALLLVHHARKSDGVEATAARGSGALSAFVDTIVELRRFNASDRADTKRILTGYGRHEETPTELVIDLTKDGYRDCGGDRDEVAAVGLLADFPGVLPDHPPGLTADDIISQWHTDRKPSKSGLQAALRRGVNDGILAREGEGKRGSAFTFWMPVREAEL